MTIELLVAVCCILRQSSDVIPIFLARLYSLSSVVVHWIGSSVPSVIFWPLSTSFMMGCGHIPSHIPISLLLVSPRS